MARTSTRIAVTLLLLCAVEPARAARQAPAVYDVRSFGGRGDGKSVDSDAINKAVEAAAAAGNRGRGPEGTPAGSMRRVHISHVVAYNAEPRFASIIAGIPGHPVEEVTLSDIRLVYRGGGTPEDAKREPPEVEGAYPEPGMFGTLPAFGFYVRHARDISLRDIVMTTMKPDSRPPMLLQDVRGMLLDHVEAPREGTAPLAVLRDVSDLNVRNVRGVADGRHERIAAGALPYKPQ